MPFNALGQNDSPEQRRDMTKGGDDNSPWAHVDHRQDEGGSQCQCQCVGIRMCWQPIAGIPISN